MGFPVDPSSMGLPEMPMLPMGSPEIGSYGTAAAIQEAMADGVFDPDAPIAGQEHLPKPLTLEEKKSIISQELRDSTSYYGGELSEQRKRALDYFHGRPFGNEKEGRSQVVEKTVLKTVRWAMPALMKIMFGGQYVAQYQPRMRLDTPPELAELRAEEATEFVDQQFRADGGFMHLYTCVMDALIEKTGIGKCTIDERVTRKRRTIRGLNDAEFALLMSDPSLEPVEHSSHPMVLPNIGQVMLHDVTVVKREVESKLKWENVPNEHFMISRRTAGLSQETPFVGDRRKMTKSSLIAMGMPPALVLPLPSHDAADYEDEYLNRFSDEETSARMTGSRHDVASQEVWVTDCYILMDADGDGEAERIRFLVAGSDSAIVILHEEEEDEHPYYSFCPMPLSHKFYGLSLADLVMDLQVIRSQLLRGILDNIYLNNAPPTEVLEGEVNLDDLMARRPGGVVRVMSPGAFVEHPPQQLPRQVFDLYQTLQDEVEQRSGITRSMQHMDVAAGKNQTLGGIREILAEGAVCLDMIARVFAETGLKDCFRRALKVLHEHGPEDAMIRYRGGYVPVDPRNWDPHMDVIIDVALGAGQSGQRMETLGQILSTQMGMGEAGLSGRVVSESNIYNTAKELVREAGYRNPDKFFQDPASVPPPEPEPNPKLMQEISQARKREQDADRDRAELMLKSFEAMRSTQAQLMQATAALEQAAASMVAANKPKGGGD